MRRLSKALVEQEQNEANVAICQAMTLHDQCRVGVLQYHFTRLEHILAYLDERTDSIPSISSGVQTTQLVPRGVLFRLCPGLHITIN